ncbi:short-chain fatty acid transporter [Belliella aquatica]|uniref:short-chain fatty acid transporter n=1 Tax=Belliella aquatica TaxID=1323734 RepID=UPI001668EB0B|nr:TIGR00366 family protein [Belliella aquatica]MCH7406243.1 TIGR00366 family protein [Belliella aquatica]
MDKSQQVSLSPTFVVALILSLIVYVSALFLTQPNSTLDLFYALEVLKFWQKGFWELLEFTLQMVLILIFGHALAISNPVNSLLVKLSKQIKSNTAAVLVTGMTAIAAGYINWGFGLILGAVLAREIGLRGREEGHHFNYPLIAASGYLGMMVWHGGFSGSAPLKVAEEGHFLSDQIGLIAINKTIFSDFNLYINVLLVLALIGTLMFLARKKSFKTSFPTQSNTKGIVQGKDKLGLVLGLLIMILGIADFFHSPQSLGFIDLNYVNFMLLGAGLLAFQSLSSFIKAVTIALTGAVEIILQFPFYAGILGIMKYSGLLLIFSEGMVALSSTNTFPLLAFLSAALVNFFIPSGGGQWAIQGPIIMDAATKLGLDQANMVMVFSYGDQLSNMLQPFWALPLLAITGVPAKDILKYTAYFFFVGLLVFGFGIYFLF